ncbi:MAG: VanW family protein [bacterium]|nr:VanW family protein [bacterium]
MWKRRWTILRTTLNLGRNLRRVAFFAATFVVGLLFVSLGAYVLATKDRTVLGLTVAGVSIGNLTRDEVRTTLRPLATQLEQDTITLESNGVSWQLRPEDLGVHIDIDTTVDAAWDIGRSKNLRMMIVDRWRAALKQLDLQPILAANPATVIETLNPILLQVSSIGTSPTYRFQNETLTIEPGISGTVVDRGKLVDALAMMITRPTKTPIEIPLQSTENMQAMFEKNLPILSAWIINPPILQLEDHEIPLEKSALVQFFTPPRPQSPLLSSAMLDERLHFYPPPEERLASISDAAIAGEIQRLANTYNTRPVNALFRMEGGRVLAFRPSKSGKTIDATQSAAFLRDVLTNIPASTSAVLPLPVQITAPEITTDKVNNLGITALLGRGVSLFAGSIPNRIFNIGLSASRMNGILVAPGQEFSFNATVGEISESSGFKKAYVIQEGRTVLDDGGGVCQVSTTLFRAALNAGLPIEKRTAHAYRVGYYEQNSPPGFDATVFSPTVDFAFKNDTDTPILIQTTIVGNMLTVELYGKPDGRSVTITKPTITNEQKPPDAKYQDDPTIPKGTTQQVDWEAWGATVKFRRTVTRSGETLYDATFQSIYRNWQAVYLVGTG